MRIPEHHIKNYNFNPWLRKSYRVKKVHEDEFESDLEDSIKKRTSEEKRYQKKPPKEKDIKNKTYQEAWPVVSHLNNWS